MLNKELKIYVSGSSAITIEFGNRIDEEINRNVLVLFHQLQEKNIPNIADIIPAYCTLTIVINNFSELSDENTDTLNSIREKIESAIDECDFNKSFPSKQIDIPVCYDVSFGLDIEEISLQKKISIEEIISIHSKKSYRVFMNGFLPGFAYMGPVNDRIAFPRKNNPRTIVPAGSIGIAGIQTGIYPLDSPGGWNIIGRTPFKIFDIQKDIPVLLNAGDEVKFVPVSIKEFRSLLK